MRLRFCGETAGFLKSLQFLIASTIFVNVLQFTSVNEGLASQSVAKGNEDSINDVKEISLAKKYYYTGGRYFNHRFLYRLILPRPYNADRFYPLILWLPGAGDWGTNNISQLTYVDTHVYNRGVEADYPFFFLAPQCPRDNGDGGWYREYIINLPKEGDQGDEMLSVAMGILDETVRNYSVDQDRIYLIGISAGGNAAWEAGIRYPERFAAIAPLASNGGNVAGAARLAQTPIWAFHVQHDKNTPIQGARDTVTAVRTAGGVCHLTETPGDSHDCWTPALRELGLLEWLLAQRRGQVGPSSRYWKPGARIKMLGDHVIASGIGYFLPVPVSLMVCWFAIRRSRICRPIKV
jgi:predicted peptidase